VNSKRINGQRMADQWNSKHPIGTPVRYRPSLLIESVPHVDTVTRSEAWVLGDGSAVVAIKGLSGGVHLSHLEMIEAGA